MSTSFTVFKKEMIDILRDRRTLMTAIVMPAVAIPFLMYGMTKLTQFIMEKEENKKLKLGMLHAPEEFLATIDTSKMTLIEGLTLESGRDGILSDSLDAMVGFDPDFNAEQQNLKSSKVNLWYKSTNLKVKSRMTELIESYEQTLLDGRIDSLQLSEASIDPINLNRYDIASQKEQLGKTIGGFLPYIFIIFCFTGCMYPALDLVTGEKERGTIETLLTVPASRFNILFGKVFAISVVGMAAALMGILGLLLAGKFIPDIPDEMLEVVNSLISAKFIFMLLAMLVPLCIFFAGMLSALVIKAKSFKEAQSIVSPFMVIIVIPAAMALMPGIELNWKTALIPVLNIALATKEIIAGTIQTGHYVAIVISLILLAIVSVIFSYSQFSKEEMVLRS